LRRSSRFFRDEHDAPLKERMVALHGLGYRDASARIVIKAKGEELPPPLPPPAPPAMTPSAEHGSNATTRRPAAPSSGPRSAMYWKTWLADRLVSMTPSPTTRFAPGAAAARRSTATRWPSGDQTALSTSMSAGTTMSSAGWASIRSSPSAPAFHHEQPRAYRSARRGVPEPAGDQQVSTVRQPADGRQPFANNQLHHRVGR
jgi:hypothetical protein